MTGDFCGPSTVLGRHYGYELDDGMIKRSMDLTGITNMDGQLVLFTLS
jgi:hypothetical protein